MFKLKPIELDCSRKNIRNAIIKTIKQGESCTDNSSCRYFYRNKKCVVGHFLSDEQAKKLDKSCRDRHVESGISYLINEDKIIPTNEFKDKIDLNELQKIHDFTHPSRWLEDFNKLLKKSRIKQITKKEIENA